MHERINYHGFIDASNGGASCLLKSVREVGMSPDNLWGGRFSDAMDPEFAEFNRSLDFDQRLFEVDIRASLAHCNVLRAGGVLNAAEADQIAAGLEKILEEGKDNPNYFVQSTAEDIHSFVESRLVALIGEAAYKLHTGRSRNDQVATDLRMWLRDAIDEVTNRLRETLSALVKLAEQNLNIAIPGYTHLQPAQPILLSHWCLAYFEMLRRDRARFRECRGRLNVLPLGSAALAGTSYPIDRLAVAKELGFDDISGNSLDAVSDRDFCIEFAAAASITMMHLSRLAEDIIIYSTSEFGFIELGDRAATGSSLMPQKKNPDAMELIRGKSGRVFGNLISLLTIMKGLPLAYNKDMQEDKEAVFDTADTLMSCLKIAGTVLVSLRVDPDRTGQSLLRGYMNATELADYLVRKGMPFRKAHEVVGRVVQSAMRQNLQLTELSLETLKSHSDLVEKDVYEALSLERTLATKQVAGGTAHQQVKKALKEANRFLDSDLGNAGASRS